MQKSEKFTPSQSERCFTQEEWISLCQEGKFNSNKSEILLISEWKFHSFKSEFSLFLESDHSNHSFLSEQV